MADTITTAGLITSFGNTPQANEDYYAYTEEQLEDGVIWLDVMSNDLGGKAKTLYSISTPDADGDGDVDSDDLTALLTKYAEETAEYSELGAKITIGTDPADGKVKVKYEPGSLFDYLAEGETAADTFRYAIRLASGALSWDTVTITIAGTNDAPVVTDVTTSANEDGAAVTAAFAGDDVDSDDDPTTLTYTVLSQPSEGSVINNGDGTFTFDPGTDFQDLAEGEERQVTFTYKATDSHGADSSTATVTVTVTGANDAPVITIEPGDSDAVGLAETNSGLAASDTLTVTDVDLTDVVTPTVLSVVASGDTAGLVPDNDTLKSFFSVSPSPVVDGANTTGQLTWDFNSLSEAFDYLEEGQELILTYTVRVTDDSGAANDFDDQTVTIKITGTSDAPVNADPVAADDHWFISTKTNAVLALAALVGNDSDPDGDDISVTGIRVGNSGGFTTDAIDGTEDGIIHLATDFGNVTIDLNSSTVKYDTNGSTTELKLDYEISDGNGGTDIGTLTVTPVAIGVGGDTDSIDLNANPYNADAASFSYIDAGNGADTVMGGAGVDTFIGGPANDILKGSDGNDTINGGQGDDLVTGGKGDDTIDVGINNDTVHYTSVLDGTDTILNFDGDDAGKGGQDVLTLDALFDSLLTPTAARAALVQVVDLDGGSAGPTWQVQVNADGIAGFELIVANIQSTDTITVGADVLVGTFP